MQVPSLVQKIIDEVLENLEPYKCYSELLQFYHDRISFKEGEIFLKGNLILIGVGKSSSFEVQAMKKIIDDSPMKPKLSKVISYTKEGYTVEDSFEQMQGTHPLVSEKNIKNTENLINELKNVRSEDTLLFLISGGTSSLLELPLEGLSFEELQSESQRLLDSGLNINEMNKRRKELSQVKNGGLLKFIKASEILQLLTCDIPNENLADVGSGPLINKDVADERVTSLKGQSASLLLERVCAKSERVNLGVFDGLVDDLVDEHSQVLLEKGKFYFSGGEATVQIEKSGGLGGRNTHYVLALAHKLYQKEENRDIKILSVGTDGSDGPTDAAGAYIDYDIYSSLDCHEYLNRFDSYHYFEKVGTLIKTGPTKTNVMDLRMLWRE